MQKAVIFDIDDTLISTKARRVLSLNRVAKSKELQKIKNIACLEQLNEETAPDEYSIDNALKMCRILEKDIPIIKEKWFNEFITNDAMVENGQIRSKSVEGAQEAVSFVLKNGHKIIYLTGRQDGKNDSMREGTVAELEYLGFPTNEPDVSLFMKPDRAMDDALFKKQVIDDVKKKYTILATFDDSPKNVKVFTEQFPHAKNFAVSTNFKCSDFIPNAICVANLKDKKIKKVLQ